MNNIKAVAYDFDGVWYDTSKMPNSEICAHSSAVVASSMFPGMGYEEAYAKTNEYFYQYGDAFTGFTKLAVSMGMEEEKFRQDMLDGYHKRLFVEVMDNHYNVMYPSESLSAKFKTVSAHVDNLILSNASAEHWIMPILRFREQDKFIKKGNVLGIDDFGFEPKGMSDKGITVALNKLGYQPSEVLFVEDTLKNLKVAKASYPELNTALIVNPNLKKKSSDTEGADIVVSSLEDVFDMLIEKTIEPKIRARNPNLGM